MGGGFFRFFKERGYFWFECRQVIGDDIPDDLPVDLEIPMDHLVPHACDLPPFDIGMFLFERCGKILDGFPDYFQCPYYRVCKIFVA